MASILLQAHQMNFSTSFYNLPQSFHWRHPFPILAKSCPLTPRCLLNKQKEEVTNIKQRRKRHGSWQLPPIQCYFLLSSASSFSVLLISVKSVCSFARTHWILLSYLLFIRLLILTRQEKPVFKNTVNWHLFLYFSRTLHVLWGAIWES